MKYVFFASLIILIVLSVVAHSWKPQATDARVEGLDFFKRITGPDGFSLNFADAKDLFHRLDINHDGVLSLGDTEKNPQNAETITFLLKAADDDLDSNFSIQELQSYFHYLDRDQNDTLDDHDYPTEPQIELLWCSDDNPTRREQIRLFNRKHPDYFLKLDPASQTMEKIIVQSLAGVGPDLFDCYSGYQLSTFVRSGTARDLTDDLRSAGLSYEETWPSLKPLLVQNNRVYGALNNAAAPAIWFNKRIFDEEGIPYPDHNWTWDECIELCRRLTVRNARGQITRYGLIGFWDWKLALYQHGGSIFNTWGTRCILDSPEAIAATQFMQELIYKHQIMPTPQAESALASAGGWASGVITLFAAERGAMAIGGRWWLCLLRSPDYAHLKLGAVEIPLLRLPDGSMSRRSYSYGRSTLVNAAGRNIDGAILFVKFLFSEDWSALINRQADALGPVVRFNYTDDFLFNPDYPEEDFNAVWRTALENAEAEIISPYVDGQVVDRLLTKQTDLVRANEKEPAQAMRDAARRINLAIIESLARNRTLREQYYNDLARGAEPAWEQGQNLPWEKQP